MADPCGDIAPPSALLLALEPRGLFSFARLIAAAPFLATAPRGAPQAAIVLPGLGATDRSTAAIRAYSSFLVMRRMGGAAGATSGRRARTCRRSPLRSARSRRRPEPRSASSAGAGAASSRAKRRGWRRTRSAWWSPCVSSDPPPNGSWPPPTADGQGLSAEAAESVAVKWLRKRSYLRETRAPARRQGVAIAPELIFVEAANALRAMRRRGDIANADFGFATSTTQLARAGPNPRCIIIATRPVSLG